MRACGECLGGLGICRLGRFWPFCDGGEKVSKLTRMTMPVIFPASRKLIRFYGVDDSVRMYKGWWKSKWKGKDKETEPAARLDERRGLLHLLSERIERSEVRRRGCGEGEGRLGFDEKAEV